MKPIPFVLRALTALSLPPATQPRPERGSRLGSIRSAAAGYDADPRTLELEQVESMIRGYHARPPRIENPFAAFPTRGFWLGRIMSADQPTP